MAKQQALLIRDGLPFAGGTLGGNGQQVLIPVITAIDWAVASKRDKHGCPTMKLTVALPADACPATDDISWLQIHTPNGKGGGKLRDIKVVLVFEPDTLTLEKAE